jgi:hypothetical protein
MSKNIILVLMYHRHKILDLKYICYSFDRKEKQLFPPSLQSKVSFTGDFREKYLHLQNVLQVHSFSFLSTRT